MAVRRGATRWSTILCCGFAIVAVNTGVVRAEPLAGFIRTDVEPSSTVSTGLDSGGRASRRWLDVWGKAERRGRRSEPDWLRRRSGDDTVDSLAAAGDGTVCIVLQEDRPDGTELLTARYTLQDGGTWRTYAGAGLNHTQYFFDDADLGTTFFTRRNRRSSLGAAAEVGAEMQVSQRVLVTADLRWADLHDRAEALRSDHGPVVADTLLLGLAVGYRFR